MLSFGIIFIYLICGGFIAIVLYELYRDLSALLNRYLDNISYKFALES